MAARKASSSRWEFGISVWMPAKGGKRPLVSRACYDRFAAKGEVGFKWRSFESVGPDTVRGKIDVLGLVAHEVAILVDSEVL